MFMLLVSKVRQSTEPKQKLVVIANDDTRTSTQSESINFKFSKKGASK